MVINLQKVVLTLEAVELMKDSIFPSEIQEKYFQFYHLEKISTTGKGWDLQNKKFWLQFRSSPLFSKAFIPDVNLSHAQHASLNRTDLLQK